MADFLRKCIKAKEMGKTSDEVVRLLHDSGLSITESMKVVMKVYEMSLGQAKEVVGSNPVWHDVVEASKPLHETLAKPIDDDQ